MAVVVDGMKSETRQLIEQESGPVDEILEAENEKKERKRQCGEANRQKTRQTSALKPHHPTIPQKSLENTACI
jgi:hypothetical protein